MKPHIKGVIAILIIIGFFVVLGGLIWAAFAKITLDGTLKDVLLVMLGTLGSMTVAVVSYYFGSSLGSAAKDDTIKSLGAKG